jgi:hypothetical protein
MSVFIICDNDIFGSELAGLALVHFCCLYEAYMSRPKHPQEDAAHSEFAMSQVCIRSNQSKRLEWLGMSPSVAQDTSVH